MTEGREGRIRYGRSGKERGTEGDSLRGREDWKVILADWKTGKDSDPSGCSSALLKKSVV